METRDWGKTVEDMRAERERIRRRCIKKAVIMSDGHQRDLFRKSFF